MRRALLAVVVAIAILLACTQIPAVRRRLGFAYAVYTIIVLGMPLLGSANFASNGRFVLMAFPVFAVLGQRLAGAPQRDARLVLGASALLLVLFTSFWSRGFWMA